MGKKVALLSSRDCSSNFNEESCCIMLQPPDVGVGLVFVGPVRSEQRTRCVEAAVQEPIKCVSEIRTRSSIKQLVLECRWVCLQTD